MTSPYRCLAGRSNGSMVIRSTSNACSSPARARTAPIRRTIASKAVGQSSSVPSSSPIRCRFNGPPPSHRLGVGLGQAVQVVGELAAPPRPVVGHVVPPHVELVRDALLGEQAGQPPRARLGAGGVLP